MTYAVLFGLFLIVFLAVKTIPITLASAVNIFKLYCPQLLEIKCKFLLNLVVGASETVSY